jgi:hypothetical protein
LNVLKTLVCYRWINPGSEWQLHRDWFKNSAMADLLEEDASVANIDTLYRCLDKLGTHKTNLFTFLKQRWVELFHIGYEVLPGNTSDKTTPANFLEKIEKQYGKIKRLWLMDRGIPTEETLELMRSQQATYLVGTPRGRPTRMEKQLIDLQVPETDVPVTA